MKNSLKFGFLALAVTITFAACGSGTNDGSTSDSTDMMEDTSMSAPMDTMMTDTMMTDTSAMDSM